MENFLIEVFATKFGKEKDIFIYKYVRNYIFSFSSSVFLLVLGNWGSFCYCHFRMGSGGRGEGEARSVKCSLLLQRIHS